MRTEFKFTLGRILALLAAAFLFGCGPQNNNRPMTSVVPDRAAALKALGSSSSGAAAASAGWNCPSAPNVTLKDNISLNGTWDYTGTENFTVCRSANSILQFKVTGSTMSTAVCFYPMNQGATGSPQLVAQPQCWSVTGKPITPDFSNPAPTSALPINYMVIVDVNYTNAMSACLSSTNPCPPHSEGFVTVGL